MIATHASTGADASLIIQRIHTSNSVRLNHRNKEKMQNYYDVLLKRFIGVGDALYGGGNGGDELGRYSQLDELTKTLYNMAQDAPDSASAVWGRRLGTFQNAHAKRLRDSELVGLDSEEDFTAWPSTGTLLLLRAAGHIFPMTDLRHVVATPVLLLLGQILGQSPVRSLEDVMKGLFCSTLMFQNTKDANRLAPEALAFLAGTINLFAEDIDEASRMNPIPTFASVGKIEEFQDLRSDLVVSSEKEFNLSLEREVMQSDRSKASTLVVALRLVRKMAETYSGKLNFAEAEAFDQISRALLRLQPTSKATKFPEAIAEEIQETAHVMSQVLQDGQAREPLRRRTTARASELAIKTLAPRMEDPTKYVMAKDKNKSREQAEKDRLRREYKREHKAVSRELRLDAAFVESERTKEKQRKDDKARAARHKNFAWMEQEQATMNQQVAQGGGLLSGGGTGAARKKAKTGKIGMKKGGKF